MQIRKLFRAIAPILTTLSVIFTAAILMFAIYFTDIGKDWITFLSGILVAAILAEATRVSRAEWLIMRRTAQLASIKEKFEREKFFRNKAEKFITDIQPRLQLIDEVLPTMIALIDNEGHCQYHNNAFMKWLQLRPEQIHGRHMREVLGNKIYQETATAVRQSLDGHSAHYERIQKMPDGAIFRLFVEHIPQFGVNGKVTGFYMLMNDITSPVDVQELKVVNPIVSNDDAVNQESHVPVNDGVVTQEMFLESFSEQVFGNKDSSRIITAIENGDFRLYCQLISPLTHNSDEAEHYEILVRLIEEEESMIPPGSFFPLAEKFNLMPHLDHWVVQKVTEWASRKIAPSEKQKGSMYFINVSSATVADQGFPEFLQLTLLEHALPGKTLCFEIPATELAINTSAVAEFARKVSACGCKIALGSFGRDRILFDRIRGFRVDYLKIDGSIIFDMLNKPADLAKIIAIHNVAKKIGVKTIAELVESEESIDKLKEIGIDFAQGFGISRPRALIT